MVFLWPHVIAMLCPSHPSDSEKVRIHPVSFLQTISSSLQSPRRIWPRFCLFLLSSLPVPFEHLLPQANFLSLIVSLSCAKTILLLSGLLLPLISLSLWTYCPSLSFLPEPHFSFPVDPPGWFLPYPSIPSGFSHIIDTRPNSLLKIFPLVRMGDEQGEGLQLFQMLCCWEYFPYCACLKYSLYRWQNEMCHLIISPICTAGNLSSKQSAVTIWFSEYQRLSETWAEGKEEKR